MKSLIEIAERQLSWTQPNAFKRNYELRAGDDVAATLDFKSSFGSFATGRSGDGCWTFKRVGFWQTRATIRECERGTEIGSFKNNTWKGGGTLELPDGRRYLATTNIWQTKLEFQTESETPIGSSDEQGPGASRCRCRGRTLRDENSGDAMDDPLQLVRRRDDARRCQRCRRGRRRVVPFARGAPQPWEPHRWTSRGPTPRT